MECAPFCRTSRFRVFESIVGAGSLFGLGGSPYLCLRTLFGAGSMHKKRRLLCRGGCRLAGAQIVNGPTILVRSKHRSQNVQGTKHPGQRQAGDAALACLSLPRVMFARIVKCSITACFWTRRDSTRTS